MKMLLAAGTIYAHSGSLSPALSSASLHPEYPCLTYVYIIANMYIMYLINTNISSTDKDQGQVL